MNDREQYKYNLNYHDYIKSIGEVSITLIGSDTNSVETVVRTDLRSDQTDFVILGLSNESIEDGWYIPFDEIHSVVNALNKIIELYEIEQ